jgi:uncharacterized membrane protein
MARHSAHKRSHRKGGGVTTPVSRNGLATGRMTAGGGAVAGAAPVGLDAMLRAIGGETEVIEHEVFDGTRQLVAHLRRQPSAVHNVNQEAHDRLSLLDRVAIFITDRVGTFGFFLIILGWTVFWLLWNSLAPARARFDPGPAFVFWLFISNMIQIFLMPLLMVGQNLQGRHSELRAEADFDVNKKAEQEVEAILVHLENQAAQIQRQGELILQILQHLEWLHTPAPADTSVGRSIVATASMSGAVDGTAPATMMV